MSDGRSRSLTSGYAGKRAFYKPDMARKSKAAQATPLPPRCVHCRLPGNTKLNGIPHCDQHVPCVDGSCGWDQEPVIISPPAPWQGEGTTEPIAQVAGGPKAFRGRVWRLKMTTFGPGALYDTVDAEVEEELCSHAHRKQEFARRCGERMAESRNGRLT